MTNSKKCEHPACNCRVENSKTHCSPACSDSRKSAAAPCGCEHKECKTAAIKA
jgi:hypothetical protein